METKICIKCQKEKLLSFYSIRSDNNKHVNTCRDCVLYSRKEYNKKYKKEYYLVNKSKIIEKNKDFYFKNKNEIKEKIKEYSQNNKEKIKKDKKKYYQENKERIKKNRKEYYLYNKKEINYKNNKYKNKKITEDISFKLRRNVSSIINTVLKINKTSKRGLSILNKLPYSIQELKLYLESQFESWMNWDNWGTYRLSEWNDNDPSTWKWNIDHIVPQSSFKYQSMEDEEFKRCWQLDNLRPYSAKQNILDGNRR